MKKVLSLLLLLLAPSGAASAAEFWREPGQPAKLPNVTNEAVQPMPPQSMLASDEPKRLPKITRPEVTRPEVTRPEVMWPEVARSEVIPVSATSVLESADEQAESYFTMEELKTEMKELAWTKGDFRIVPYGALWADMVYSTARNAPGAYTTFIPPATGPLGFGPEGEDSMTLDARRTRLGLDISGPKIPFFNCAESGGRVEIDFQNNLISTENRATILLRHAYWEAKNENFRFLVGQTWDVFSPLNPGTLNYSVGWLGGNIGYRRAQFRLERYHSPSERFRWGWQAALAQDIVNTLPGAQAESANWPVLEGRIGCTLGERNGARQPITLGVSSHIGQTGYDILPVPDDQRFTTWSLNADVRVPISQRMGVQGEFFTGANLSPFLGGIGQGVSPGLLVPVRSTGGWFELWYDWSSRWHSHAGFGIDNPNDADLLAGGRTYNQFIFGNLIWDVTNNLTTGLEVSSWKTLHQGAAPGEAVTIDWMMKYAF